MDLVSYNQAINKGKPRGTTENEGKDFYLAILKERKMNSDTYEGTFGNFRGTEIFKLMGS